MAAILKNPLGSWALSMRGTLSFSPHACALSILALSLFLRRWFCPCLSCVFWRGEHGLPSAWTWFRLKSHKGHKVGQIVLEAHVRNETKCSYCHQKFREICEIWSPTWSHMVLLFDPSGISLARRCVLDLHECLHTYL